MPLDTQQRILIEQRVTNDTRSPVIAYFLLVFLGGFGAHRFYLGKTGTAFTVRITDPINEEEDLLDELAAG